MKPFSYCQHMRIYFTALVAAISLTNASTSLAAGNDFPHSSEEDARITQYAAGTYHNSLLKSNVSIISQNGNDNQASVIQSRSASYQMGNIAYIYQDGYNNQASISQNNGANIGLIKQVGSNHTANISQTGGQFEIKAQVTQFGRNSDIALSQSGSGLRSISVEQQNYSGYARPVTIDTN
ncbi:hypothetical protein KV699_24875 [Vreelandella titanicae]|jgi:minor curlin subunit|uniref:hypothetical protein n=1 Tax=Halomonadaceae TaxID=28256 RepID=UPI000696C1BA|nr:MULTISPECIES: hypothetical protein [Halomonas]MCD1585954.1 hypothetical protein [Halomonas sp. IOP_14]